MSYIIFSYLIFYNLRKNFYIIYIYNWTYCIPTGQDEKPYRKPYQTIPDHAVFITPPPPINGDGGHSVPQRPAINRPPPKHAGVNIPGVAYPPNSGNIQDIISHHNSDPLEGQRRNDRAKASNRLYDQNFRPPIKDLTDPPPIIIGKTTIRPNSFKNQQTKQNAASNVFFYKMAPMRVNVQPSHNSRSSSKGGAARLSDVGPGATMHCTSVQSHTCQELWSCAHKCAMWCVNPHRDEKGELPQHSRLDEFCCAQTKPPDSWQLCYQIPHSTHKSQMCLGTEKYNHSINGCRVFGIVYEVHKEQKKLPLV